MSAGVFQSARYVDDDGEIYAVRVQPETLAASLGGGANADPGGTPTVEGRLKLRKTRREFGLHARTVTVKFTGAAPTGYKPGGTVTVPILSPAVYAGITTGGTGTYLGSAVEVTSKSPEFSR